MDKKYSDIELAFLQEVLLQHGKYLSELFAESITQKKLIKNQDLLRDLQQASSYAVQNGNNPTLKASFPNYGRFIEIDYHKSKNVRQFSATRDVWGVQQKNKKHKDTRWYTHNLMGSLNRLMGIIGNELTESERQRIKALLDSNKIDLAL